MLAMHAQWHACSQGLRGCMPLSADDTGETFGDTHGRATACEASAGRSCRGHAEPLMHGCCSESHRPRRATVRLNLSMPVHCWAHLGARGR